MSSLLSQIANSANNVARTVADIIANSSYPVNFYFTLQFLDLTFLLTDHAFQEVSGISKELGIEEVGCGGENKFKYRLPTTSTSQNLVLKRALVSEGTRLIAWCENCMGGGLTNKIITRDVMVTLMNSHGIPSVMWLFHDAYPVKYALADLNSMENKLSIESIELAYTYFDVISPGALLGKVTDIKIPDLKCP